MRRLSPRDVIKYALMVAERLGVKMVGVDATLHKFKKDFGTPVPEIYFGNGAQLWVDKHYIAYSWDHKPEIHYVYMDGFHIREECFWYSEGKSEVPGDFLPDSIRDQFVFAYEKTDGCMNHGCIWYHQIINAGVLQKYPQISANVQ